jgi:hypothetical protein
MNSWQRPWDEPIIDYRDYAIGGKMVTVSVTVSEDVMVNQFSDPKAREFMRHKLCEDLAAAILSKGIVEINQAKNPYDFSTKIVARAYLAPDDQVKLIRTLNIK